MAARRLLHDVILASVLVGSSRPKPCCFLRCVSDSSGDIVVLQAYKKLLSLSGTKHKHGVENGHLKICFFVFSHSTMFWADVLMAAVQQPVTSFLISLISCLFCLIQTCSFFLSCLCVLALLYSRSGTSGGHDALSVER